MHEANAVESILRITNDQAHSLGAARVTKIRLVVGEATGYMEESLAFFLDLMAKGGPSEGAALEIEYVKTRMRCSSCGEEYERKGWAIACPRCGSPGRLTGSGDEFYVDSIDIEKE